MNVVNPKQDGLIKERNKSLVFVFVVYLTSLSVTQIIYIEWLNDGE
jgi:hypothetical protein